MSMKTKRCSMSQMLLYPLRLEPVYQYQLPGGGVGLVPAEIKCEKRPTAFREAFADWNSLNLNQKKGVQNVH